MPSLTLTDVYPIRNTRVRNWLANRMTTVIRPVVVLLGILVYHYIDTFLPDRLSLFELLQTDHQGDVTQTLAAIFFVWVTMSTLDGIVLFLLAESVTLVPDLLDGRPEKLLLIVTRAIFVKPILMMVMALLYDIAGIWFIHQLSVYDLCRLICNVGLLSLQDWRSFIFGLFWEADKHVMWTICHTIASILATFIPLWIFEVEVAFLPFVRPSVWTLRYHDLECLSTGIKPTNPSEVEPPEIRLPEMVQIRHF